MSATTSKLLRPDAATLRRLYVDDGKGCPEIGRLYGRDPKTVLWWLRQASIETRKRGQNPLVQFKKGERSRFAGRKHRPESIAKLKAASAAAPRLPHLRGGKHWLKGAPPEMNPRWLGGVTPERQAFYRSEEWKQACVIVWHRADAKCERCGLDHRTIDRTKQRFHVHHIVSFAVEALRADPNNLALLCWTCHRFVHSKANVSGEFLPKILELA